MSHTIPAINEKIAVINGIEVKDNFLVATLESLPPKTQSIRLYARAWGDAHGNIDEGGNPGFLNRVVQDVNNDINKFLDSITQKKEDPYKYEPAYRSAYLFAWLNDVPLVFEKKQEFNFSNYYLYCDIMKMPIPEVGTKLQFRALHVNKSAIQVGFEAFIRLDEL